MNNRSLARLNRAVLIHSNRVLIPTVKFNYNSIKSTSNFRSFSSSTINFIKKMDTTMANAATPSQANVLDGNAIAL
jgi:hypothetical protein